MKNFDSFTEKLKKTLSNSIKSITLIESHIKQEKIMYNDLLKLSKGVLGSLQSSGIEKGDQLILQADSNKDFLIVFLGCVLGGICVVPIARGYNLDHKMKLLKIWQTLDSPKIICHNQYLDKLEELVVDEKDIFKTIKSEAIDISTIYNIVDEGVEKIRFEPDDIVHIQFSSGSTGDPKGVVITQENLVTNLDAMYNALKLSDRDIAFSWMPLTHDMGLVCHLLPLLFDIEQHSMPTDLFVRNPNYFLKHIQKHKVSFTQSPNFGLNYLILHDTKKRLSEVDLTSLRIILNGAEPINYDLCVEFIKRMEKYKINPNVICPGYGLAEATLAVSISLPETKISKVIVDRRHVSIGDTIVYLESTENKNAITFVKEGNVVDQCQVQIRDNTGKDLVEDKLGIICIKGKNVSSGFYNNPEKTKEVISEDHWLDTGDLGFFHKGELVVVGRMKDVVIVNGQNYYSHDLERIAERVIGIELGKIVITSGYREDTKTDMVVAFLATKKKYESLLLEIRELKTTLMKDCGVDVKDVVLIPQIPKTTSGKFQRYKLAKEYSDGKYDELVNKFHQLYDKSYLVDHEISSKSQLETELLVLINEQFNKELKITNNFFQAGFSSLELVQMAELIHQKVHVNVEVSDFFKYSTIRDLSEYILNGPVSSRICLPTTITDDLEIAIVGIGLDLPLAVDLHEFWDVLVSKLDVVRDISYERKEQITEACSLMGINKPQLNPSPAAYLEDITEFDYKFFNITPVEALSMSPAQRKVLKTSYLSIENAGYSLDQIKNKSVGVYIGYMGDSEGSSYQKVMEAYGQKQTSTGRLSSNLAGRVSFFLDIHGPSMIIDTACSSSLVALHQACQDIKNGNCDSAIVSGVRIQILPGIEGKIGIESNDCLTRPFEEKSTGTGNGEGIVSVYVKPLDQALKNRDNVYAVIKGSFCNQDGNSISISSPNMSAQESLIVNAYKRTGVNPEQLGYLEAHGTGTPLGDPVEIKALTNAILQFTDKKQFCSIGSVKGNIGHLYEAAGLASIVKSCLMLKHKKKVGLMHYEKSNANIDFSKTPFYVDTMYQDWVSEQHKRMCGVSSFGFSGTNVHMILEEYEQQNFWKSESELLSQNNYLFTLSAKSKYSLMATLNSIYLYILSERLLDVCGICHTLSRRTQLNYRIAFLVSDYDDLILKMETLLKNENDEMQCYYGVKFLVHRGEKEKEFHEIYDDELEKISKIAQLVLNSDQNPDESILDRLAQLYVRGAQIDWSNLYNQNNYLPYLPGYKFNQIKIWPSNIENRR